ncbi:MBL fold metallo-hydrolase [Georgfuchsia toluolica]|uniref:MBL fold metallo-hydrolase n=1 Tax=Georgfuchsia toluolica TaxID=424218 RepID=A0A916J414_9PROT|nr:MBL fold metallo-hydrolase [Georgfuchsia toluolica]CAG4883562.1 MBL fold metallo-hydrolase [Georgfuchsia toluolica]
MLAATHHYGNGIYVVDSGFIGANLVAIHLIVEKGRVAIVDTAVNATVPRLLHELAGLGLTVAQVDYVILTHVHLDHAGGAGQLMAAFPAARLVVHPRGARHMIDPSKLIAATYDVYGRDNAIRMYGEILPISATRVIEASDKTVICLAGRELLLLDSPGHARHHICIRDSHTGHIFTGDTFGLSHRQFDSGGRQFIYPTTTPSQFDPDALHRTVDMIAGFKPSALYVTHFGQVRDIPRLAADMHRLIDAQVEIAMQEKDFGADRYERIRSGMCQLVAAEAEAQGWGLQGNAAIELLSFDIALNAKGIDIWLGS